MNQLRKELRKRLMDDIVKDVDEALTTKVSPDVFETVAQVLYGPTRPLVPGDPSSTLVSTGIDAIVGGAQAAVRAKLNSRLDEKGDSTSGSQTTASSEPPAAVAER